MKHFINKNTSRKMNKKTSRKVFRNNKKKSYKKRRSIKKKYQRGGERNSADYLIEHLMEMQKITYMLDLLIKRIKEINPSVEMKQRQLQQKIHENERKLGEKYSTIIRIISADPQALNTLAEGGQLPLIYLVENTTDLKSSIHIINSILLVLKDATAGTEANVSDFVDLNKPGKNGKTLLYVANKQIMRQVMDVAKSKAGIEQINMILREVAVLIDGGAIEPIELAINFYDTYIDDAEVISKEDYTRVMEKLVAHRDAKEESHSAASEAVGSVVEEQDALLGEKPAAADGGQDSASEEQQASTSLRTNFMGQQLLKALSGKEPALASRNLLSSYSRAVIPPDHPSIVGLHNNLRDMYIGAVNEKNGKRVNLLERHGEERPWLAEAKATIGR